MSFRHIAIGASFPGKEKKIHPGYASELGNAARRAGKARRGPTGRGPCSAGGRKRLPFQAAFRTLDRPVHVVVSRVARTGVGLGQGQLIVLVGVAVTESAAAGGTGAARVLFTKPTKHPSASP